MGAFDNIGSSSGGNTVGITIKVVDDNSAAVVQKVEQNLGNLAGAGTKASTALAGVATTSEKVAAAAQTANAAISQLGLSGTGLGRAAEHASLLAQGLSLLPGAVTAAGAGIGLLGAGLLYAWQQWSEIRDLADDYNRKVKQAAETKLIDTASLETAVDLLNAANEKVAQLEQKKQDAGATSFLGLVGGYIAKFGQGTHPLTGTGSGGDIPLFTVGNQQDLNDAQKTQLETTLRVKQEQHELYLEQIRANHATDGALNKQAQIEAHLKEQLAVNKENLRYRQDVDGFLAKNGQQRLNPQDDVELTNAKNTVALGHAMAERSNLARQDAEQALRTAQQAARELEQFQDKLRSSIDARVRSEARSQSGLPGIEAERQANLDVVNGSNAPDAVKVNQRVAVNNNANTAILRENEQFQQKLRALEDQADGYRLQGYARIDAETNKRLDALEQAYSAHYGEDRAKWQGYQDEKTRIEASADQARMQLATQTNTQIRATEDAAARALLPEWQQAQQAIIDQYNQRVAKAREEAAARVITAEQADREIIASGRLAQAELERQAMQTRDRLAGELQSFFDNPAKYIENRAKEMMFKILANWVEQLAQAQGPLGNMLQQLFGMGPNLPTNAGLGGIFGNRGGQRSAWDERIPGIGSTASVVPLTTAATSLTTAGGGLSSSAAQLSSAATALSQAATAQAGGFGGTGAGLGGFDASGGQGSAFGGILNNLPGIGGSTNSGGLSGIVSNIPGLGGGGAEQLNGGGFQPTDIIGAAPDIGIPGSTEIGSSDGSTASGGGLGGKLGGFIGGGIQAGMGIYSALKSGNALQGALQVGMAGFQIGNMIVPGLGGLVGGIVGAVGGLLAGIFGDHGLGKAKQYEQQSVKPKLTEDVWAVSAGQMGYGAAESDLTGLYSDAKKQTSAFGSAAKSYFNSTIGPEINAAIQEVKRQQASGRNEKVTWGAAQFDSGGFISGFGDMATGPYTGFIHATLGERVMRPAASAAFGPVLDAMNTGSLTSRAPKMMPAASAGASGGETHIHVHALDAKSVDYWLRNGGAQRIQSHLNGNVGRYAGVALG